MPSSGILSRVVLARTDVSEEPIASITAVKRLSDLGTLAETNKVLTRATRRNNQEDGILHSHRHENLKSYIK
jgi:hypothetical protein